MNSLRNILNLLVVPQHFLQTTYLYMQLASKLMVVASQKNNNYLMCDPVWQQMKNENDMEAKITTIQKIGFIVSLM